MEWAGLEVPKEPPKQLNQREKDKVTTVFTPKVRKRRGGLLEHQPKERTVDGKTVERKISERKTVARQTDEKRNQSSKNRPTTGEKRKPAKPRRIRS